MTKQDVIKALRRHAEDGDFITKADIARTLSMKRAETATRYVKGLQILSGKYYFIPEVAERIMLDVECPPDIVVRESKLDLIAGGEGV